jgi:O-antigen/teichoic acid export membrane protein
LSTLKQLAGQTAIYGLSSIVGRLLNVLLVPVYTRVFATGEYGVVTQMYAYVAFLNILFTYGMETAYFRFSQQQDTSRVYGTGLLSVLGSSVLLSGLLILFSSPLAAFLSDGNASALPPRYITWFALIIAADAVAQIPFARLRQENKALRFAAFKLIGIVLNVLLNLFFLIYCPAQLQHNPSSWVASVYDPSFGVGYVFVINVATSLLTLALFLPGMGRVRLTFDPALWKRMMIYALPLMVAGLAGMINETFDRIMIPRLVADKATAMDQLGIYGACYKLSILMTLFIQTFRFAAEPFFFSMASRDNARETYARVMHYFVMLCALIFLAVMLYMDVIKYFIGKDFHSGLKIVPVLLMANLCLGVFYNLSVWYKLSGKTHWGAWLALIGAAITLLLNFLLIPRMGYMGAAWATLICYGGMMVISYLTGQRHYPVPYNVRSFVFLTGSALAVYGLSTFIRQAAGLGDGWTLLVNSLLLLLYLLGVFASEARKNSYLRVLLMRKSKDENQNH